MNNKLPIIEKFGQIVENECGNLEFSYFIFSALGNDPVVEIHDLIIERLIKSRDETKAKNSTGLISSMSPEWNNMCAEWYDIEGASDER